MRSERRHRVRIYFDTLSAICSELRSLGEAKPTRVQYRVNVPYDRLKEYLNELARLGMIQMSGTITITEKGHRFLAEYGKVLEFLTEMGLISTQDSDTHFL